MRRLYALLAAVFFLWLLIPAGTPLSDPIALPLQKSIEPAEFCLMPPVMAQTSALAAAPAADFEYAPGWPGKQVLGGNVPPTRMVFDPHPTFNGMAVDPENGVVVFSDENRSSLLTYELTGGGTDSATTPAFRHIIGSRVNLGFVAGVALDPLRREIYAVNNDGGGLTVHSYDSHGDVRPLRRLIVPHQAWGLSLDLFHDELAVTSQQYQGITIYRRTASGADMPARTIRGDKTLLADPHGVYLDPVNDEVTATNHGNWTEMRTYSADGPPLLLGEYVPGRFEKPSIRVFRALRRGNTPPIRSLQGPNTGLAWPMGIAGDPEANELAVANYGTNEILIFDRAAHGDVAPKRILGGSRTGIVGPVGVAIDRKNGELWVANYGDHTAVVFDREASGNVAPKRVIRNAPKGTPTTGFTNASAAAYDSIRDQLLVPN